MTGADSIKIERLPYDPAEWAGVLGAFPEAEVYHSPEWLAYLASTQGAEPVVARVLQGERAIGYFVGATVKRFGLRILGSPLSGWGTQVMGFLLDPRADRAMAARALPGFAFAELGCAYVELGDRRLTSDALHDPDLIVGHATSYLVDLTGSEAEILGRMRATTRNYVRRAARIGLISETARGVGFADEYHEQLRDVFASHGLVPTYGVDRVRRLIEHLEPSGQVQLIRIREPGGASIATTVTIGRNRLAVLWGAAFFRAYAHLHPNEILHWETMRGWRSRGVASYDMGGEGDYKAKYGGEVVDLYRYRRARYAVLEYGRTAVRRTFYLRQRLAGRRGARVEQSGRTDPPSTA
jgi:hypothetical protein